MIDHMGVCLTCDDTGYVLQDITTRHDWEHHEKVVKCPDCSGGVDKDDMVELKNDCEKER